MRMILIVAGALIATVTAVGAEWTVESIDVGSKPDLELNSNGQPCVAYMVEAQPGGTFVACRDDDGWQIETVATGYFYAPLDLVIDDNDTYHVAYHDHDAPDAAYAQKVNGSWRVETVSSEGHDGWDPSLAIADDGTVHLLSIDPSQFGSSNGVEHARRVLSNVWQVENIGSGPIPYEFGTASAFTGDGVLHVLYHDGDENRGNGRLLHASQIAGQWQIEVLAEGGDVGKFPSLAVDSQGRLHAAYLEWRAETIGAVHYAVFDTGIWTREEVAEIGPIEIGHFGARRTVAVALDQLDRPALAYCDQMTLQFAQRDADGWTSEVVAEQMSASFLFGQLASLAIDQAGQPHIAFYELPTAGNTTTGTIYYASAENPPPPRDPRTPRRPSRRVRP